jgi:hypothetical protein
MMSEASSRLRFPAMVLSMAALLAAIWAGLVRLGWDWPVLQPSLPLAHGPLMVAGFLGTLIAVERAVALKQRWTYLGPLSTATGSALLLAGYDSLAGPLLIGLGSLHLLVVFVVIVRRHPALYTLTMAGGAACWLAGNLLWLVGWPIYRFVFWWAGFLVLTIAGERLELGRLVGMTRRRELCFLGGAVAFATGLAVTLVAQDAGTRLAGIGLLGMTAWLLRYDIARRTVRKAGLPRFAAISLLSGYLWLGLAGLLSLVYGAVFAGPRYDAVLHSIFLGFVFSMIFAHAPIIFPAVLNLPVKFHPVFYLHLALLHGSLLVRIGGDFLGFYPARLWGGLLNGVALLVFIGVTAGVVIRSGIQNSAGELQSRKNFPQVSGTVEQRKV